MQDRPIPITPVGLRWYGRVCPRLPCLRRSSLERNAVPATPAGAKVFDTPQQAADALIEAAENVDVAALTSIFGPDGNEIVFSGEFSQDRKHAANFAAQARQKNSVS